MFLLLKLLTTQRLITEEDYKGGKIIFGQGSFVLARNYANTPTWGEGFAVIIDIIDSGVKYEYVPYNKTDVGITYDGRAVS